MGFVKREFFPLGLLGLTLADLDVFQRDLTAEAGKIGSVLPGIFGHEAGGMCELVSLFLSRYKS